MFTITHEDLPKKIENEKEKNFALEQYKLVIESVSQNNSLRESANNYWATINALGTSTGAYILDSQMLTSGQKPVVLWVIAFLGIILCIAWLSFLNTLKKDNEIKQTTLLEIEKYFPFKIFSTSFNKAEKSKGSLTFKEMIVPCLFLATYIIFAIYLIVTFLIIH